MNLRLELGGSFLIVSDFIRRTLFAQYSGRVFIILENSISRRFLILNDGRPSKGPSSVIANLRTMLIRARIGHKVLSVSDFNSETNHSRIMSRNTLDSDIVFIPVWTGQIGPLFEIIDRNLRAKILLGPNLSFLLRENGDFSHDLCYFIGSRLHASVNVVVPHEKIARMFIESAKMCNSSHSFIRVLSTGVDEKYWKPAKIRGNKILIYLKGHLSNVDQDSINEVKQHFNDRCVTIQYGKYSQAEYRKMLQGAKIAIFFAGTESQGLAILEAWSCNVPTLIRIPIANSSSLPNESTYGQSFLDYAPYLNQETGAFFTNKTELLALLYSLENSELKFNPRLWAIENFGMKKFKIETLTSLI